MPDYFATQDLIGGFDPTFSPEVFDHSLLIVGLGGNGTHLALAAARMGFSRIVGIDCDVVSECNLSRQVLYTKGDVGRKKADVALESLSRHNLRSKIETHHLDILAERARFGDLVAEADLVFVVLDQPSTTFFAVDTCFHHRKPTITGGTCVLSGLSTRAWWMGPGQSPCLNCLIATHDSMAEWVRFYRWEGDDDRRRSPEVEAIDKRLRLEGGHLSTYPTACIGSNLMIGMAVNIFRGRTDLPRGVELSVLDFTLEARDLKVRSNCPTCFCLGLSA
ncbi:HesA/MoeB/ThiF family protein [Singulisphaera rosea]